jgi:uridine phosphorylase
MTQELFNAATMNGPGKPDGPPHAILAFTRKEFKIFSQKRPNGKPGKPIVGGFVKTTHFPDFVLAGPILGAPMAGMVLETLGRRGCNTFLSLGWCGALSPSLRWGDIVLPEWAISEEGTSAHYPLIKEQALPDPVISNTLANMLEGSGVKYARGGVWTTDAPFRETREKVVNYADRSVLAVDMETSAVMTVARFRQWRWAGLMVVSDELWGEKWNPGFHSDELAAGLDTAAEIILEAMEKLKKESA